MIRSRNYRPPEKAVLEFSEWASLFPNGLFVKIAVYSDESGTHDPSGKRAGSREALIAGFAAPVEDWKPFCQRWQAVLNKYSVRYFHFWEWSKAYHALRKGRPTTGPYSHLNSQQLDSIVLELATIAGSGNKTIVGNGVYVDMFNKAKAKGKYPPNSNPYCVFARDFFDSFVWSIERLKPVWKRMPVDFFFDQTDNREFRNALNDGFHEAKKSHRRFDAIVFADKKVHLPLQAADMVAYRSRQISQNFVDDKVSANWAELDEALFKPMFSAFDQNKKLLNRATLISELHKQILDAAKKRP